MLGLIGIGKAARTRSAGLITGPVTLAIFGDSMTAQNHSAANIAESVGYMNALQMVTGRRYLFDYSLNFGVSGNTTGDALARVSGVADSAASEVVILLGANDRRLKYTAQYSIDNMTAIIAALRAAGKKMTLMTSLPCRDALYTGQGLSGGEIIQAKADILVFNTFLRGQAAADLRIADTYEEWIDTDGQCLPEMVVDDGLHPNPTGGFHLMKRLDAVLTPIYGIREFTASANNKLANIVFSGTGGTVPGSANGVLADGHTISGTAPSGSPSTRTLSKATGQAMAFSFPAAGSTRDNFRIANRYTADETGKTAYYECELRITDAGTGAGAWHALSAELLSSAGTAAIGYDRAAVTDAVPAAKLKAFCEANNRKLHLRTPTITVPSSTYLEGRVNLEANTTGGARSGAVELLNEQLVVA